MQYRPPARSDTILVTSYTYDAAGRTETVTDPRGIVSKSHYDDAGRSTATIGNYKSGSTYWTLEPLLPKSRSADVCQITGVTYDVAGNSVTQTAVDPDHDGSTADNQVTIYNFQDAYNPSLTTRIKYPDSVDAQFDSITLVYALDGQVVTRTAQRKTAEATPTTITFDYDLTYRRLEKQRVTSIDAASVHDSVKSMKYTYDPLGRRWKITSYSDAACSNVVNEVLYEYNEIGALAKEYQAHASAAPGSPHVDYRYDEDETDGVYTKGMRLNRVKYPNGRFVHYTYSAGIPDDISRVDAIKNDNGFDEPGATSYAAYSYCGAGRMVVEDFKEPEVRLDYWGHGGAPRTYAGFDQFGRVKQQLWRYYNAGGPADRDKFTYEYDRNSNRLGRHNAVAGDRGERYQYDSLNRLVNFAFNKGDINSPSGSSRNQAWTLDQAGNWRGFVVKQDSATVLDQTRANNKANEITSTTEAPGEARWAQPAYSARGNMTSVPQPADLTSAYTCKYDAWNRLVEIKDGGDTVGTYKYDGLSRRIHKSAGGATYDYYYNNSWQMLEVRKDGLEIADLYEQYVWSLRYIDAPVLRYRDTTGNGELNEHMYYLNDANMNVTALVNTSGTVVERCVYDPYGKVKFYDLKWENPSDTSAYANEILYCGYRYDPETGLYHVGMRMYHPTLGRWPQRDPIGYADGMNLYEYVGSGPINWVDYSGNGRIKPGASPKTPKPRKRNVEPPAGEGATCGIKAYRSAICTIFPKKASDYGHEWLTDGTTTWDFPKDYFKDPIQLKHKYDKAHPMHIWNVHVTYWGGSLPNGTPCKKASCRQIKACLQGAENEWHDKYTYNFIWRSCINFVQDYALKRCCMAKGILKIRSPGWGEEKKTCCEREKEMDRLGVNSGGGP